MQKIIVSKNQRYSCLRCGRCCRRFNVRIEWHEIQRLQALDWGDEPHPVDFYETIHGHYYFKRKPDGGCVFLDDCGVCRIHARFGFDVKALTCRGYPMNIISTAPGELSVLARMDCPAVLADNGATIASQQRDIMKLVAEMTFGNGFSLKAREGLERPAIDFITQECHKIARDTQLPIPRRLLWMARLLEQCQRLGPTFINDLPTLKTVWLNLMRKAAQSANDAKTSRAPSIFQRTLFRAWLALYCRRDEECVSRGLKTRFRNFLANLRFILGVGSWHDMGFEHPDISARRAGIFTAPLQSLGTDDDWKPFLNFIVNRLDTLQFFGAAFYSQPFFKGLNALILTYPLVLADAKANARADNRDGIAYDDVFKAVLAIDHCHGRSPSLNSAIARHCEAAFTPRFLELAQSI